MGFEKRFSGMLISHRVHRELREPTGLGREMDEEITPLSEG